VVLVVSVTLEFVHNYGIPVGLSGETHADGQLVVVFDGTTVVVAVTGGVIGRAMHIWDNIADMHIASVV
jgi:hypothetical protein